MSYISERDWNAFPCTCTPEQETEASLNEKCSGCRAEYSAWSEELEARGIIGPWETFGLELALGPQEKAAIEEANHERKAA